MSIISRLMGREEKRPSEPGQQEEVDQKKVELEQPHFDVMQGKFIEDEPEAEFCGGEVIGRKFKVYTTSDRKRRTNWNTRLYSTKEEYQKNYAEQWRNK